MLLLRAIFNVTREWLQPIYDVSKKFLLDVDIEKQRLLREKHLSERRQSASQE